MENERAAYRQPRHSDAWAAAHAAAVKAQRAKSAGWWASLTPSEQTRRAAALSERFAAMSLHEQLETKHLWATRDARAGIDPKTRHAQWLARQDPDDLARRAGIDVAVVPATGGDRRFVEKQTHVLPLFVTHGTLLDRIPAHLTACGPLTTDLAGVVAERYRAAVEKDA